jgi:hypothetical protein
MSEINEGAVHGIIFCFQVSLYHIGPAICLCIFWQWALTLQVFCVSLWCLDEYWYYNLFTPLMLILCESTIQKIDWRHWLSLGVWKLIIRLWWLITVYLVHLDLVLALFKYVSHPNHALFIQTGLKFQEHNHYLEILCQ